MFIAQEGVAGSEHENRGEQIPLDFEQGIRAGVEQLAHERVAGADHHRNQHQPHHASTGTLVDPVDQAGNS